MVSEANVPQGKPVIWGTRGPGGRLLGSLAGGRSIEPMAAEDGGTEADVP